MQRQAVKIGLPRTHGLSIRAGILARSGRLGSTGVRHCAKCDAGEGVRVLLSEGEGSVQALRLGTVPGWFVWCESGGNQR